MSKIIPHPSLGFKVFAYRNLNLHQICRNMEKSSSFHVMAAVELKLHRFFLPSPKSLFSFLKNQSCPAGV